MYSGGDAAEQVVRLSLEGFDVAARLTGSAAKNVAILLAAALREEHKTKGKTRLTNMIRSGKELKVFSIPNKDLPKFIEQAKRYGVLYCLLKDKDQKDGTVPVDIIARAEDASKIQRIFERFELGVVDKASIITEAEKDKAEREQREAGTEKPEHGETESKAGVSEAALSGEQLFDELLTKREDRSDAKQEVDTEEPIEEPESANPTKAVTEKDPLSAQSSGQADLFSEPEMEVQHKKPSVKEKLEQYRQEAKEQREAAKEKSKQKDRAGNAANRNRRKKSKQKKQPNNRKER